MGVDILCVYGIFDAFQLVFVCVLSYFVIGNNVFMYSFTGNWFGSD